MSKSSVVSAPKIPASQLPTKSAWAKGPPQSASPRSQSPAPSTPAPVHATHSRRPSTLGQGIPIKDGVSIPRNNVGATKTGSVVSFGSIDDASAPISSSPAATPAIKSSAEGVKTFGSVPATVSQMNGKSSVSSSTKPPLSQASSSTSISGASTSSVSSAPAKPKMDIRKFFQNPSSSPSTSQSPSDTNSPSLRPSNLPPQSQPSTSNAPMGAPPFPTFVPSGMRPPPNSTGPGVPSTPRSPNYPRQQMPNGNGPRPPNGVNTSGPPMQPPMGSPRLAPHPHPGQQPNMQPQQMQPPVPMGWGGYYAYGMPPGMPPDSYMYPPPWGYGMPPQMPPPHPQQQQQQHPSMQHHPSQGPPHPSMPMSPRNPPPPLQSGPPGTPTPSHASAAPHSPHPAPLTHSTSGSISGVSSPPPTPSSASMPGTGRLNTNASAFIPRPSSKIVIKSAIDGSEVNLENLKKSQSHLPSPSTVTSPPLTSSPSGLNSPSRRAIRIEDPEAKRKRQEKEKEETQAKLAAAEKERLAKEEEEKKAKEAKEKEEERIKKEKEEAERKVKEEAERKAKEEAERKAKEEEEERQRIKAEEEEKQRLAEEERIREEKLKHEAEEKLRKEKEEEERKKEEEQARLRKEAEEAAAVVAAAAAAAKAKAEEESKVESKIEEEQEEGEVIESEKPSSEDQDEKPSESEPKSEEKKSLRIDTTPAPEHLPRRRPGPLDLSTTLKPNIPAALPSALATARIIDDLGRVPYPEGIRSPKIELNVNAKDSKFRYDRDFLLQFMSICKEKPDNLPALDAIGLESSNQGNFPMARSISGRGRPGNSRTVSVNVGFPGGSNLKTATSNNFSMGNFGTTGAAGKLTSEERYHAANSNRTVSMTAVGNQFNRPQGLQRTASSGGPGSQASHPGRTRSKRGEKRGEVNKAPMSNYQQQHNHVTYGPGGIPLEPVAPLQQSENRWDRRTVSNVDPESPEIVDRKVKGLLNKLTMEKFDSISDQIIAWANKSENQKDGRTLIQVIRLVFEKATDEAAWSEMYARLCRKMMEQISPKVQDDGIKNADGKPIAGGHLFRKYLLNRCQEDFERGWVNKEATAAAAATKASEDQAAKAANELKEEEEIALYSDEYYAAQKAKRQGLGLIKFIGELFKLQMLTERIMHECVKKLLGNVENPEEEEIESLCKLLTTVGQMLDTTKARAHMDVYFSRMKELTKSPNVSSRMQFMLQDIIELRERKWTTRNIVAAPTTIAKIHEAAAKEKAAQEKESHNRMNNNNMSRGGSRRGADRNEQPNADGWTTTAPRPPAKVGDLSKFGQINKSAPMTFGPSSVFAGKKESKRESLSRTNSSANMFQMLQNVEAAEAAAAKTSRPPSRKTSIDLGPGGAPEPAPQRKRLILQPRTKPVDQDSAPTQDSGSDSDEEDVTEEPEQEMSEEEAKKKIGEDTKEFFAVRSLDEAEVYFSKLPSSHHHTLVDKLVSFAIESKPADATLVGDLFLRASSKKLCSSSAFEAGFISIAEFLDDIVVDAPKATDLLATMIKGAELSEEQRTNISSKSAENGDKLLQLSS
ncbi:hypothetical protein BT96DRAFT_857110 [Gymnopus androsaceus JB14]|uniref:MI domain-containing protein n=1 Tax=Gymnopus androsaceus JB14 TaxID=1447944 RepID=A0A6A4HSD4_9AGAR|nr:hypothetical protein BT96DRAFT_857110 [Gymnopus androsaceus JB14]